MIEQETMDKIWNMIGGRKFLAWMVTTGMHIADVVDAQNWMVITLVYIGGQTAIDALAHLRGTKTAPGPQVALKKPAAKKKAASASEGSD